MKDAVNYVNAQDDYDETTANWITDRIVAFDNHKYIIDNTF